jgi:periplasmic copper chaperone A
VSKAWKRIGLGAVGFSLAAASAAAVPAGAATATSTGSASGSATRNGMQVTGAFVPLPPSPSVAAAYLELHNLTGRPDTLMSISTSVASSAMAMSEGASSMQMLGPVTIPAHGTVSFVPGHDHVMLQGLTRKLAIGQDVDVRLRFRHAGTLSIEIPVVPLDRILGGDANGPRGGKGNRNGATGSSSKGASTKGTSPTTMGRMAGM